MPLIQNLNYTKIIPFINFSTRSKTSLNLITKFLEQEKLVQIEVRSVSRPLLMNLSVFVLFRPKSKTSLALIKKFPEQNFVQARSPFKRMVDSMKEVFTRRGCPYFQQLLISTPL
jgi:hypothetical protein